MSYPFQITSKQQYDSDYAAAAEDPDAFWAEVAENFAWKKKWDTVSRWNFIEPDIEWFYGAKLNITENALDRHVETNPHGKALIWEPNDPDEASITYTYTELLAEVCKCANALKELGIEKGDRVCIYMGMVPALTIAVLACARIGAIHSVIFGGFSAQSIADRLEDAQAEFVITCDGAFRGAKDIPLKNIMDDALLLCPFVKKVLVYERTKTPVSMIKGRDYWWEDLVANAATECDAESMHAEDILFILYTSGSTGKPKGVVHTCGGYMVWATYTFVNVFQYKPGEVFFCTADIGWVTGHSYIVYGPLCAGATSLMFEGVPTYPDAGRFWDIVEKHEVNILYTAPTAIRSLMACGNEFVENKKLDTLRVLGTVGEPINEEAWQWYDKYVGKGNCPIVDTWWQTETGGVLISNLAGITDSRPCWATLPLPGIIPVVVDEYGEEKMPDADGLVRGNLCIKAPWPGMIRSTYGDHERCRTNYFATYSELYFSGDGCIKDAEGNYRITGRVDDVLNVSGHRIGTAEVENAINMHTGVVESAVVGYPHDIKGVGIYAFIIVDKKPNNEELMQKDIAQTVSRIIGPIAKPDKIQFVTGLPKTRSGKIMRRVLRKIAEGNVDNLGDTSTLLDPGVVEEIVKSKK